MIFIAYDVWEKSEKSRCFVDAFGGCSAGISRLDKKIKNSSSFIKRLIPTEQPPNTSDFNPQRQNIIEQQFFIFHHQA
jgi:hypothetical protein